MKSSRLQVSGGPQAPGGAGLHSSAPPPGEDCSQITLRIFDQHADFVWRTLRRLGVPEGSVDDGAQRVFMIVLDKAAQIEAGKEASFLYGTVRRVASDMRESYRLEHSRRSELDADAPGERLEQPDALLERKRARQVLDGLLDELDLDVRAVFVLFELEGLRTAEIAELLQVPSGTVASRLRRARELVGGRIAELERRTGERQ